MLPSTAPRVLAACCVAVGLSLVLIGVAGVSVAALDSGGAPPATTADPPSTLADANSTTAPPESVPGLALPERVELDGSVTDGTVTPGIDVGAAVHSETVAANGAYDATLLEARLETAPNETERQRILDDALSDAEERVRTLRDREHTLRVEYQSGSIDEQEFLTGLRAVSDTASAREQVLEAVPEDSDAASGQASILRRGYVPRQSPLRSELTATIRGDHPPTTLYVASASEGTVLSTIDSDYVREVHRDDLLQHDDWARTGSEDVLDLLQNELYPDFPGESSWTTINGDADSTIYWVERAHDHGSIRSYIDVATEDVFREEHEFDLNSELPTREPLEGSAGSITLQVNRTYPSGPARVSVTNDSNGSDPVVDAPIVVDGEQVATTGASGRAWVVLPYGQHDVEIRADGTRVTVGVSWGQE